ncbi:hypothetical protein F4780DRAFT_797570 [Xylariomycetidae sp. FL0641]|nr:hypothetical protein F4780DRAFT_797570 [Xylariomycetidae sp. FL0641]
MHLLYYRYYERHCTNSASHRLLSHYIQVHVLDPSRLSPLLRTIRAAVFPNNAPGSSSLVAPSSDEQLAALRRRCASALLALVPAPLVSLYHGGSAGVWSGTRAHDNNRGGMSSRTEPLNSSDGAGGGAANAQATPVASSTAEESPRVRLTDAGRPDLHSDATLTSGPGRPLQEGTSEQQLAAESAGDPRPSHRPADRCHAAEEEDEERILSEIEAGILDVFSDPYCNKHLIYGILELVLVRLIPELAERGIGELWDERLS